MPKGTPSRSTSYSNTNTNQGLPYPSLTPNPQSAGNNQPSRLRRSTYLSQRSSNFRQNAQPPSRSMSYNHTSQGLPYPNVAPSQSTGFNPSSRLRSSTGCFNQYSSTLGPNAQPPSRSTFNGHTNQGIPPPSLTPASLPAKPIVSPSLTNPSYLSQCSTSFRPNVVPPMPRFHPLDVQNLLHDIRKRADTLNDPLSSRAMSRLDPKVFDPAVQGERHRNHANHMSKAVAYQFDMSIQHVFDIMSNMVDRYDTVTAYSLKLVDEGMIIYYPEPFVVTPGVPVPGSFWIGDKFDLKVKVKGRFGVVLRKYGQHLKVAPVFTFNGLGLAAKPPNVWREYVELTDQLTEDIRYKDEAEVEEGEIKEEVKKEVNEEAKKDDGFPKPLNKPLLISELFCSVKDTAMAHLVTTSVSLGSQMMIAGRITPESLDRLRVLAAKLDG